MKIRTQSEIRVNPLQDAAKINLVIERETLSRLKVAAVDLDTTVNEIIRALVDDFLDGRKKELQNKIFFKVYYGIKFFNANGSERPYDTACTGAFYATIDKAIEAQKFWFDGMCEELKARCTPKKKPPFHGQAFSYIQAVTSVSDDNPDGDDVPWDQLDKDTQTKLNAADLKLDSDNIEYTEHW